MAIRVEFFGIARQRAGVGQTAVVTSGSSMLLGDLLSQVGSQFPAVAADCLAGDRPRTGYIVNLAGRRFVSEPSTLINDGDCVLLLSADGGG